MAITETEKIINYIFKDSYLLERALIHSSYANEQWGNPLLCNERLEFLGDSVLDMVISEMLFKKYPEKAEGELTKLRASLVCEKSLGSIAMERRLNEQLRLGKGEEACGGRERLSIAADMIESIIAAVYLDGGFEAARSVIDNLLSREIEEAARGITIKDSKTELQELLQKNGEIKLEYEIISESGPDHAKEFTAAVKLDGRTIGLGKGSSKKRAESRAAESALGELKNTTRK